MFRTVHSARSKFAARPHLSCRAACVVDTNYRTHMLQLSAFNSCFVQQHTPLTAAASACGIFSHARWLVRWQICVAFCADGPRRDKQLNPSLVSHSCCTEIRSTLYLGTRCCMWWVPPAHWDVHGSLLVFVFTTGQTRYWRSSSTTVRAVARKA